MELTKDEIEYLRYLIKQEAKRLGFSSIENELSGSILRKLSEYEIHDHKIN